MKYDYIKTKTISNILLPSGIIYLDYNENQRQFHFDYEPGKYRHKSWVRLMAMSLDDALKFTCFMDKKYVNGRSSGILPEIDIVKLEMELFFKLKNSNRKLAGRY